MAKTSSFRFVHRIDPSPAALGGMYDELRARLTDYREIWPGVARALGQGLGANIRGAGAPIGERWPSLSLAYYSKRRRGGTGAKALILSGDLVRKLEAGTVVASGPRFLSVGLQGEDAEKDAGLNFGTPERESNIRPRPHIGWSEPMKSAFEDAVDSHVERSIREVAGSVFGRGG